MGSVLWINSLFSDMGILEIPEIPMSKHSLEAMKSVT